MTLQTVLTSILICLTLLVIAICKIAWALHKLGQKLNAIEYDVHHNKGIETRHFQLTHERYAGLQYIVTENHTAFIKLRKEWHRYIDTRNKQIAQRSKQQRRRGINNG